MEQVDYKGKYEDLIKRIKKMANCQPTITKLAIESLIPEIVESEDERIVKELLTFFRESMHGGHILTNKEYDSWIAWLEKQGKNNMGISEATKQKLEDNLNKALEKETPESCNEFLDEQGEQKPVFEMKTPEESLGVDSDTYNKIVDECVYGEQNTAWSEEDNRMCKAIIDNIQAICKEGYFVGNIDSDELIKWLKSLKERYTWKPSDEQIRVVARLRHYLLEDVKGNDVVILNNLLEQLKAL